MTSNPRVGSIILGSRKSSRTPTIGSTKRAQVLDELLLTERAYVEHLQQCISVFLQPLRSNDVIDRSHLPTIFGNMELLHSVHARLLERVESARKGAFSGFNTSQSLKGSSASIADVFREYAQNLRVYDQYCQNHATAVTAVDQLRDENAAFSRFLSEACAEVNGLNLEAFLIKPIQRIAKYPLLFKELIKYTPDTHPDFDALSQALETVQTIAQEINEAQRTSESNRLKKQLAGELEGFPADYGDVDDNTRTAVRCGMLKKMNPRGKLQDRYIVLLSDMLLYAKPKGQKYECKGFVPLNVCLVTDVLEPNPSQPKTQKLFGFHVIRLSDKRKLSLYADTEVAAKSWIRDIQSIVNAYLDRAVAKPSDDDAESDAQASAGVGRIDEDALMAALTSERRARMALEDKVSSLQQAFDRQTVELRSLLLRVIKLESPSTTSLRSAARPTPPVQSFTSPSPPPRRASIPLKECSECRLPRPHVSMVQLATLGEQQARPICTDCVPLLRKRAALHADRPILGACVALEHAIDAELDVLQEAVDEVVLLTEANTQQCRDLMSSQSDRGMKYRLTQALQDSELCLSAVTKAMKALTAALAQDAAVDVDHDVPKLRADLRKGTRRLGPSVIRLQQECTAVQEENEARGSRRGTPSPRRVKVAPNGKGPTPRSKAKRGKAKRGKKEAPSSPFPGIPMQGTQGGLGDFEA